MIHVANQTRIERARLFAALRRREIEFAHVLRKPPTCVAGYPTIRVIESAFFSKTGQKRLVRLNAEAAAVGINAYLPLAALPLRGRDFFEEWTCKNVLPMIESRLRHKQTTQEVKMAEVMEEFPAVTRAGRTSKYPYSEWLDGRVWRILEGQDFEGEVGNFTQGLRSAAATRGLYVQTAVIEGGVAVVARPLTPEVEAKREAIRAKRAETKAANEKVAKNGKSTKDKVAA